jgi:hypothetical protein
MKSLKSPPKPRGGARPGAGKPKGVRWPSTLAKEAARELVRKAITEHLPELIASQVANAKGLQYLVYRDKKSGKFERVTALEAVNQDEDTIEVWEKDPSVQAFTDLLNRALDKPKETYDVTLSVSLEDLVVGSKPKD